MTSFQEQLKRTIKRLRAIRRKVPKEITVEEIEANAWALDYLEEELFRMTSKDKE